MIIYNVTCKVDFSREKEWVEWMRKTHVPEVVGTGCFTGATLLKLKFPAEDEGVTFAVQYQCPSMQMLDKYLNEFAQSLQVDHTMKFGADVVAFRTVLEKLGEYGAVASA